LSTFKCMINTKLPVAVKLGFGACDAGGNLLFTVVGVLLLNFFTDVVGISAAWAGAIVAIGKVWDAITDPLVGYWSDRTRSRWGRRRPWILFGAFPLMVTFAALFFNPKIEHETGMVIWGIVTFCLLSTTFTVVNIPYSALTPELTSDYNERSSLNAYRFGFAVIGTMIGGVASHMIIGAFPDKNIGFAVMGAAFGCIIMLTALITFYTVREPAEAPAPQVIGVVQSYINCLKNRPFVLIMLTFTAHMAAVTTIMGVAIYYFKYLHHNESLIQMAMGIMLTVALVFIPLSVKLSTFMGKKKVYAIGMSTMAGAAMLMFLFGHQYGSNFSMAMMVLVGVGLGFLYVMPWSIVPDAIDYHFLKTGHRTEGAFYGLWTFSVKLGQAIAMGITGLVFSWMQYVPNAEQSGLALLGIRLLMGPIPTVFFLTALLSLWFYPITRKRYEEIQRSIAMKFKV
jgi:glycoside/pentoside/hexuronide:cation symporter, GPH family